MLTQAQEADAGLVRELRQLNDLRKPLPGRHRRACADAACEFAEGKNPEVHV
jgi:hypothetical protein